VEISMPMSLHLAPINDDPHLCAAMFGPLVLGGLADAPVSFRGSETALEEWIRPVPGLPSPQLLPRPLAFTARGLKRSGREVEVTFIPLYRIVDEAFGVYFPVNAPAEQDPEYDARKPGIIDEVFIGDPESESEHALAGEETSSGTGSNRNWRHAVGGWFSYKLKASAPCVLCVQFWGDETGARAFEILADGEKIAAVSLARGRPGKFYWREFPIPEAIARRRSEITVRFQARPGNIAGGVFHVMMVRAHGNG
jgi:hypothetical protein